MALTVIGVFDNATEAQKAVEELVSDGFSRSNIDLSTQSDSSYSDTGTTTSGTTTTSDALIPDRHRNTSGTYTEEIADDAKDTGSSIGNFFSSLFGGSDDADRYSHVGERSSIVTVHVQSEDEAERAADILDDNGAVDVNERAEQYGYGSTAEYGTAGSATGLAATQTTVSDSDYVAPTNLTGNTDQTIKVVQEDLQVGKREVETGGVRVRSRIVERPVEESLRLREERVRVQRTPVNRPATADDLNAFQEGQIEVVEHAEVPVVSKTANVVEEISVGKEVNERVETIRDTVRSTDVDVENIASTDPSVQTRTRTDLDDDTTTYTNR